ncbi:MAG: hypothetical protein JST40_12645 [Armatimonadetes bacterium]|nr:hypothetical protein [Armatimonadota bacterium]
MMNIDSQLPAIQRCLALSLLAILGGSASAQTSVTINQSSAWAEVDQPYITVSRADGNGAVTYPISSDHPEALNLPESISFANGETSKYFYLSTKAVTNDVPTTITVGSKNVALNVKCVFVTSTQSSTLTPVGGSNKPYQFVYLPCGGKSGGFNVALVSTNPAVIGVPSSVLISQGTNYNYFYFDTFEVPVDTPVSINAILNGHTTSTEYTVKPIFTEPLSLNMTTIVGGSAANPYFHAYLNAGPVSEYVINLTSSDTSYVQVPAQLKIAPGASNNYTYFTTSPVTKDKLITITGKSQFLGANAPERKAQILVKANTTTLDSSRMSYYGGTTSDPFHYVRFLASLGATYNVPLTSSDPAVIGVPSTVAVSAGTNANYFYSTSYLTPVDKVVTLTANYFGNIGTVQLFIKANKIIDLQHSPGFVQGGQGSPYAYAVLADGAPKGGANVALTSSNPTILQVPASVNIGAGSSNNYYYFTTSAVTQVHYPRVTATFNQNSYTEPYAVLPPAYNDVSGIVSYGGLEDQMAGPRSVDIDLRDPSTHNVISTFHDVPVADDGTYVLDVPSGTYELSMKVGTWLRRTVTNITSSGVYKNFDLINGDVDDDNGVTVFDYLALSDAFDSSEGSPNWNPRADLDLDGLVTVFDYLILSDSFDTYGDE